MMLSSCRNAALAVLLLGAPLAARAQPADAPPGAEMIARLAQADANHDGQITRAELQAYRAAQFGRLDRNGDGVIDARDVPGWLSGRFGPRMQALLAQFDANHDGHITRQEWENGPTPGFDLADADHDGRVTASEMRAALAKARAR